MCTPFPGKRNVVYGSPATFKNRNLFHLLSLANIKVYSRKLVLGNNSHFFIQFFYWRKSDSLEDLDTIDLRDFLEHILEQRPKTGEFSIDILRLSIVGDTSVYGM